jgi:hypothetical protein
MAGLSNLIANSTTQATSLPPWMSAAQQNVVNQATNAAQNTPALQNTVAQGAINQLSGPSNPFTQAQGYAGTIASGAANPWIVDQSTGQVTPNVNTALGGLFSAQNQQLQQLAPNIMAQPNAQGINAGGFGSLRSQTAADKALTDAQAQLFASQNTAALNNQQTGVQAANVLGNLTNQYATTAGGLANMQQTSPFTAASNLGKTIAGMGSVPTTTVNTTQTSPLNQLIAAGGALQGGTAGLNAFLNQLSPGTTISSLWKSLVGGDSSNPLPKDMTQQQVDYSKNGWIQQSDGSWQDETGQAMTDTSGNILD